MGFNGGRLPMVSLVIVGLAFFIPGVPPSEWRSAPGLDALVCLVGSEGFAGEFPVGWADGVLIGENNNYIYIGQKKRSGGRDPQIAQIPREHIGIVVVGEDADLQEGRELCGGMSTTRVMPWTGCKRKGDYRSRTEREPLPAGAGGAVSGGRVRGIVTFGPIVTTPSTVLGHVPWPVRSSTLSPQTRRRDLVTASLAGAQTRLPSRFATWGQQAKNPVEVQVLSSASSF